ncbi:hypothetical protein RclHR1_13990002 [Rhizophagus clarus]|uniref:Uncharacterized protein n=1 Tax=Rhizophagus clarus TaxID=94130 RepID=A0A2Z6QFV8_9GLOM|nr:hypothetical protein RclHR1_13990002 [Rhizophagus clarus]GET04129.1 hypothetical protein GLOIN_2v1884017 [Rhizophagus clarus]
MVFPSIPSSALSSIGTIIKKVLINRITIKIDNTKSNHKLHHGKRFLGNSLIKPLPVTIGHGGAESIEFKSVFKKAIGMITYEIDNKHEGDLPLLLVVGWKISIIEKNKWFVFIGYETDPNFPDERFVNKYLKENGNTGSNTLDFKEHSMIIDCSISDGNNAQLNIYIHSWGLLDRIFS